MINFDFDKLSREKLHKLILPALEHYYSTTKTKRVSSNWNVLEVKKYAQALNFDEANKADIVFNHVLNGLSDLAVHTPHPSYFGLFNPRTNFSSIMADLIAATFNPQLAAWSHAPFANEIENYVIQEFGKKFGYDARSIDGTFCTGGAESNLTAIICALNHSFPNFNESGINGINKELAIYCSSESHHSIVKAAKMTGLGFHSVKIVSVNQSLEMDTEELIKKIRIDQKNGLFPLMIVGTAGTTGAGSIDDLATISRIANEEDIWFHVDAAYGGAAVISEKYKSFISGIECSDSITLDLHKWFSIPMGASLFLTSHKTILHHSFSVKTKYMPEDGDPKQIIDPYLHSVQWSRRFIGLKIYIPLAIHGWEGYEHIINSQIERGALLREMLQERAWEIRNHSPLPVICFSRKDYNSDEMYKIVNTINDSGKAWLSVYPINDQGTGRVCITNYSTGDAELNEFVELLENLSI